MGRPGPWFAMVRERRRPAGGTPRERRYGLWWVHRAHRPVEVGPGLRLLAGPSPAGTGGDGPQSGEEAAGEWREDLAAPRRAGRGQGLEQRRAPSFAPGLEQARLMWRGTGIRPSPTPAAGDNP
ncbi:hypothetical protein AB0L10_16210 [Streptomyces flaveolus]|uniref:hypothetical protein n=1 Tax=Streptomyces flaveolus TaxID=67297 RepID=UPI003426FFBA